MILLLIDILIYNYTSLPSLFFIINLNDHDYLKILGVGLFLDLIVLRTLFLNTIFLTGVYLLRKYYLKINLNNFLIYYFFNLIVMLIYYLVMNLVFNYINLNYLLLIILINSIGIFISYKLKKTSIDLIG